jgi:hypothetical protein
MDDDKPAPSAGEIVFNSRQDTLYTHASKLVNPMKASFSTS